MPGRPCPSRSPAGRLVPGLVLRARRTTPSGAPRPGCSSSSCVWCSGSAADGPGAPVPVADVGPPCARPAAGQAGRGGATVSWSTPAVDGDGRRGRGGGQVADIEIGIYKSGRRAYGFDDIAIVPSRRTRDPEDVDISWEIDAYRFELPLMAAAMDGVVSPRTAIEIGRLGGPRRAQPRGPVDPLRGPRAPVRGDRQPRRRQGDGPDAADVPRADQARARHRAHPRDQRRRASVSCASVTPQRTDRAGPGHPRRRARPARHPGHRGLGRARLEDRRSRST